MPRWDSTAWSLGEEREGGVEVDVEGGDGDAPRVQHGGREPSSSAASPWSADRKPSSKAFAPSCRLWLGERRTRFAAVEVAVAEGDDDGRAEPAVGAD